jgi:NAD(P)-dependent dehydrogenase (short-subunit alcohol dehydrogenase family)
MPKEKKLQPPQHQRRQPGREHEMKPRPKAEDEKHRGSGKLRGKVAIITGGDSGIGRAVAIAFAKEGADVAVLYLEEHKDAQETEQRVEEWGRKCLLIDGDVGNEKSCQEAVKQTVDEFGKIDIVINNAASTKGAITAFTRSLSQALAEKKIRVNGVPPGPIWTPLIPSTFPAKEVATFGSEVSLGRPSQPEEIAPSYVFLASDDSSYMTGQVLHPNGGTVVNG